MNNVKNEVKFLAYCVEIYKSKKGISGKNAYNYLYRTGATDFIIDCYGALHTTGPLYIVDSIDDFIANNYRGI
ncbi:MAG: DUF3791 domain-containing protein [Synergistaceae bacterium]|nr:DUF3791 domain-containing protein [Synergistaceae bacterium]